MQVFMLRAYKMKPLALILHKALKQRLFKRLDLKCRAASIRFIVGANLFALSQSMGE